MRTKPHIAALSLLIVLSSAPALAEVLDAFHPASSFSVSATGIPGYSIPVEVPPGPAGMQPSISVNYSDNGSNGVLGLKWGLSFGSSIDRCPAIRAVEGFAGTITMGSGDRFCLDGQRLILISGTYGTDGSEYRTEIDSFVKVKASGGTAGSPDYFTVWHKNGNISQFKQKLRSDPDSSKTVRWSISREENRKGVATEYNYAGTNIFGQDRIVQILYGINPSAGAPYGLMSVDFEYEDRSHSGSDMRDTHIVHAVGHRARYVARLNKIRTSVWSTGWKFVRGYKFAYDEAGFGKASRLTSVTECDYAETLCKQPITIGWNSDQWHSAATPPIGTLYKAIDGFSTIAHPTSGAYSYENMNKHPRTFADVNGDGLADLVAFGQDGVRVATSKGDGTFNAPGALFPQYGVDTGWLGNDTHPRIVVDVNGDGSADILGFGHAGVYVALAVPGTATFSSPILYLAQFGYTHGFTNENLQTRTVADVDGDGWPDIVAFDDNGVSVARNTGSGFTYVGNVLVAFRPANGFTDQNSHPRSLIDMNGDGRADIVGFGPGGVYVSYAQGTGMSGMAFSLPVLQLSTDFGSNHGWANEAVNPRRLADVNGDGLPDVVGFWGDGVKVALNTGTGLSWQGNWVAGFGTSHGYLNMTDYPRMLVDMNGDGRADIVGMNDGTRIALSTGSAFRASALTYPHLSPGIPTGIPWMNDSLFPRFVVDVTGDGRPELVGIGGYDVGVAKQVETQPADTVFSFNKGYGVFVNVQRDRLTKGGTFYQKGTGAGAQQIDLMPPMYVTRTVTTPDGRFASPTNLTKSYEYRGYRVTRDGRGALGFAKVIERDDNTEFRVETTRRQDAFPYYGAVQKVETYRLSTLLSDTTTTYNQRTTAGTARFIYPAESVANTFSLDGQHVRREKSVRGTPTIYGEFPTVTDTVLDQSNVVALTVDRTETYATDDVASWLVGRKSGLTERRRSPNGTGGQFDQTRQWSYAYTDPVTGRMTQIVEEPSTPALSVTTTMEYDAWGNVWKTTTTGGSGSTAISSRVKTINYGARGTFPEEVTNALGQVEYMTYDAAHGGLLTRRAFRGNATAVETNQYDALGRLVWSGTPIGTGTAVAYQFLSAANTPYASITRTPRQSSSPGGAQIGPGVTDFYDRYGRNYQSIKQGFDGLTPSGNIVTKSILFDQHGRPTTQYDPYVEGTAEGSRGKTVFEFDWYGRPTKQWVRYGNAGGDYRITSYSYGVEASTIEGVSTRFSKTTVTDPRSNTSAVYKNPQGHVVKTVDPSGKELFNRFDAQGNRRQTRIPATTYVDEWSSSFSSPEVLTTSEYDIKGRRTKHVEPNSGTWQYAYDAVGQLIKQTDPLGLISTTTFDVLGRPTGINDSSSLRVMTYDTCTANSKGQLCSSALTGGSVGYSRSMTYDVYGRVTAESTTVGANTYSSSVTYDAAGRTNVRTFPTGYAIKNVYSSLGYLTQVQPGAGGSHLFRIDALDSRGQIYRMDHGNGVHVMNFANPYTGAVTEIKGTKADVPRFDWQYGYYDWGGLHYRDEISSTLFGPDTNILWQVFDSYDKNGRLFQWNSSGEEGAAGYDALGRIRYKAGAGGAGPAGVLKYAATVSDPITSTSRALPHAVSGIAHWTTDATIETFGYDAKGQMTGGGGRALTWKAFGQPETVTKGGTSVTWVYGSDNQRVRQTVVNGAAAEVTTYLGEYETETTGGITEHRHFLSAGGRTFAVYKSYTGTGAPAAKLLYLHPEALGSVTAVTDAGGAVVERTIFDPWGKRLNLNGTPDHAGAMKGVATDRGFTGHEHVDEVRLINMNGRVYDPLLGRFLSPDPFAQSPDNIQSHDRYAYVLNDPMSALDPSGYWSFSKMLRSAAKVITNPFKVENHYAALASLPGAEQANKFTQEHRWAQVAGRVVAGYFGGPAGAAFVAGYEVYLNGGDGGDIRRAIGVSLATSYAMQGIGSATQGQMIANVAGHAAVGCASAAAGGGSCRDGAISAGIGAAMTHAMGPEPIMPVRFAGTVVAGGLASGLTGGDVRDGAHMAAVGFLFNSLMHPTNTIEAKLQQAILKGDVAELRLALGEATSLSASDALIAQRALATMEGLGAENSAMLASRYGVDWANKVGHIFESAHQGSVGQALVGQLGSPANAMLQVQRAVEIAKPSTSLFSNTFNTTVNVQGVAVQVRGALVNGVYRIGTIQKW